MRFAVCLQCGSMTDKAKHPPLPKAFKKLGVSQPVLKGLADAGFEEPSEIQGLVITPALEGYDILGQARTGTGKTGAFGIPLLCEVVPGYATQALILVPTRELCVQVESEMNRLGKHTPLRTAAVYGGERITAQMKKLKHSPEIIVATPGRMMDLLQRRVLDFANIRMVVLDEVDRMLDIGFRDDIREILGQVNRGMDRRTRVGEYMGTKLHPDYRDAPEDESVPELPDDELQTIFVSATISPEIETLARKFMRTDDVKKLVALHEGEELTVDRVEQFVVSVGEHDKGRLLEQLIADEDPELAIVFMRTKRGADRLAKRLRGAGIDVQEIHGDLRQSKRDSVMKGFRGSKFKVLIATDLASRGIDVTGVSHIFNHDIPEDADSYVHRIGRTARMGAVGRAFTLVTPEQGSELSRIEKLINVLIPTYEVEGFEPSEAPKRKERGRVRKSELERALDMVLERKPDEADKPTRKKRTRANRVPRSRR